MKIGVSTGSHEKLFSREILYPRLKKIGYETLDFCLYGDYGKQNEIFAGNYVSYYKETARILKDCGISVTQTHGTYPTDYIERGKLLPEQVAYYAKQMEATAILGAKYIVIHPVNTAMYDFGKAEDKKNNFEAFTALLPHLKANGVKLAVENMFAFDGARRRIAPTGCSSADDMAQYIDMMQSEYFVACLDTGHMNLNGLSVSGSIRKLGERLKILHVHDNFGFLDSHNPICYGTINWDDAMTALKEINYDGDFCMEIIIPESKIAPELIFDSLTVAYKTARMLIDKSGFKMKK